MRAMELDSRLRDRLGFVPGAIAVMGKWEPHVDHRLCLGEVRARAAAAVAMARALEQLGYGWPYLLSVEGHLRDQPKAGCLMAADILRELGARQGRIRCWPAANRTVVELHSLHRLRAYLRAGGLLLVTSNYHVPRTRFIMQRELEGIAEVEVIAASDPLVLLALQSLSPAARGPLGQAIARGTRRGLSLAPMVGGEIVAFLAGVVPGLERYLADRLRGAVSQDPTRVLVPGARVEVNVADSAGWPR